LFDVTYCSLSFQLNRVYVIFDQPMEVSIIKIWNYSKTPNRGVKDFAVSQMICPNGSPYNYCFSCWWMTCWCTMEHWRWWILTEEEFCQLVMHRSGITQFSSQTTGTSESVKNTPLSGQFYHTISYILILICCVGTKQQNRMCNCSMIAK
jgi:hypothetical protein